MKKLKNLFHNKDFCFGVVFASLFVVCVGTSLACISLALGLCLVSAGLVVAIPSIIVTNKQYQADCKKQEQTDVEVCEYQKESNKTNESCYEKNKEIKKENIKISEREK